MSRFGERNKSSAWVRIMRFAFGADVALNLAISAVCAAFLIAVRGTKWLADTTLALITSPVERDRDRFVSVTTRPNDEAEVTMRGALDGSGMLQT